MSIVRYFFAFPKLRPTNVVAAASAACGAEESSDQMSSISYLFREQRKPYQAESHGSGCLPEVSQVDRILISST